MGCKRGGEVAQKYCKIVLREKKAKKGEILAEKKAKG